MFFFLMIRRTTRSTRTDTLFPYTTLFRSIEDNVGAISCGIYKGTPVLDLDYDEDSVAEADGNFVLTGKGQIVEVQASAEGATYEEEGLLRLLRLARIGCGEIFAAQDVATGR